VASDSPPVDPSALLPPFAPRNAGERWLFTLHRLGIRPGLTTIRALLDALDHPERRFPSVVVAGTNGKGSTSAFLAQLAQAAGLKTGLYTSPHLLRLNERIRVDGRVILEAELERRVERHRSLFESSEATFFESLTALAMEYFAEQRVEVAILEVGLGGRLDATNAAAKVGVVLTSVALDHRHLLGARVEEIAREKLSLCETGIPAYLGDLSPELRALALEEIEARGGVAVDLAPAPRDSWRATNLGDIQRAQAGFAAAVYHDLARRQGWPIPPAGAAVELVVAARYQLAGSTPRLILDPAHNAAAVEALLRQWTRESGRQDSILVFGQMADKELDEIYPMFHAASADIVVTTPRWPRAAESALLAERLQAVGDSRVHVRPAVAAALEHARALAGDARRVLLFGSNFLVAEALDRLGFEELEISGPSALWDAGSRLRKAKRKEAAQ